MPRVVITHAVQDVERWLGGKAERAAVSNGITNVTDLVAADGSNHAAVVLDVDDLDAPRRCWLLDAAFAWQPRRRRTESSSR